MIAIAIGRPLTPTRLCSFSATGHFSHCPGALEIPHGALILDANFYP